MASVRLPKSRGGAVRGRVDGPVGAKKRRGSGGLVPRRADAKSSYWIASQPNGARVCFTDQACRTALPATVAQEKRRFEIQISPRGEGRSPTEIRDCKDSLTPLPRDDVGINVSRSFTIPECLHRYGARYGHARGAGARIR